MGSSRGRWEGDTLVVETTNFNDKVREQSLIAFSSGENLRLTERFKRTGPGSIDYEFTVDDPAFYTRKWTASVPMVSIDGPIFEYACHEGNYGMGGILRGARAEEQARRRGRQQEMTVMRRLISIVAFAAALSPFADAAGQSPRPRSGRPTSTTCICAWPTRRRPPSGTSRPSARPRRPRRFRSRSAAR